MFMWIVKVFTLTDQSWGWLHNLDGMIILEGQGDLLMRNMHDVMHINEFMNINDMMSLLSIVGESFGGIL